MRRHIFYKETNGPVYKRLHLKMFTQLGLGWTKHSEECIVETQPHIMQVARSFRIGENTHLEIFISWERCAPSCFTHAVLSLWKTTVMDNVKTGEK